MNRNNELRARALAVWGWMTNTGEIDKKQAYRETGQTSVDRGDCPACQYAIDIKPLGEHKCISCPVDGWRSNEVIHRCEDDLGSPYRRFKEESTLWDKDENRFLAFKVLTYIAENWKETPEEN